MGKFLRRLRYWISSRRADSELAEEIEFHRAMKQDQLERTGLSPRDASSESRRALGNGTRAREEARSVWIANWLDTVLLDVRYACRSISKMPALAAVVIVSLGVGIGVNSAIFSWVEAVVLQPLPGVRNASSFYLVEPKADTGAYPGVSWREYDDLKDRLRSFRELFAFRMVPLSVGEAGRIEQRYGLLVSDNYFSGLGLQPALGRFSQPEQGSEPESSVVISHGFWNSQFGGAAAALGTDLRVNGQTLTIVGIAPEGFQGTVLGLDFDLWVPARLAPVLFTGTRELVERDQRGYSILGRLRPGTNHAQAQAELTAAMGEFERAYPQTNAGLRGELLPYWRSPRGPQRFIVYGLAVLQGVLLLLLVAVCGNTANLLLARATVRGREVGTRLAIGATPWRVVRLLMAENLILGFLGAALGLAIAKWGTEALRAVPISTMLPIKFQTGVDGLGLMFSMMLGIGSALVFGAVPALQLARGNVQLKLRSGFMGDPRIRVRNVLMGVEAALALIVLVAAALFFESFQDTRSMDPGFQQKGVLLAAYDLTGGGAGHFQAGRTVDPVLARDFADKLLQRLREVPGVESASIGLLVPLDIHGLPVRRFTIEGRPQVEGTPDQTLMNVVTPAYFQTMQIPQVSGTDFASLSDRQTPPQVIVNEEFLKRYVGSAEALGRHVQFGKDAFVIAGVVKNSFYDAFGEPPMPIVYFSYRDRVRPSGQIHVRTRPGSETLLAADVQRIVRDLDPTLPVFDVRTLTAHVDANLFLRRIPARLFIVLGPLLLFFAAIGIYSVVAYNVSHRITEIGVRIALGATRRDVVISIVRETMRVIAIGALVGILLAFIIYIHVVPGGPIDPRVFLGVPGLLLAVATLACAMPARRAAGVDPIIALRQQ